MTFAGWPEAASDWLEDLIDNNEKAWFEANKATYVDHVRGPMLEVLAELAPTYGAGKVFRPHRDVRFSHDKTPYKDHVGAIMSKDDGVQHYLQVSAHGLAVGGGAYWFGKVQLERYREAVVGDAGAALPTILATLTKAGFRIGGEALKTVPRGYARDHERAELLRHKGLYAMRSWPPEPWLHTRAAFTRITKAFAAVKPLDDWLVAHVSSEP